MNNILLLVIGAGFLAVLYGIVQTMALLKKSPGNARMQEIAAAIQEGAQAYLRRQYTAIGIVGVVVLIVLFALIGKFAAGGFVTARCCQARPVSWACWFPCAPMCAPPRPPRKAWPRV